MNKMGFVLLSYFFLLATTLSSAQSYSVVDLGTLGGNLSNALAVNDVGQVAGFADLGNGNQRAFTWSKTQGMKSLPLLHGGDGTSIATGINNSGEVVGISGGSAFAWTKSGGIQDVGNLGGSVAHAYGINNLGEVVGDSLLVGDSEQHAFLWSSSGGMEDLGTLGGVASTAYAVNDAEQVVGASLLSDGITQHAFLWTRAGGMQDLGTLGGTNSVAFGLNLKGEIVGLSSLTATSSAAFTWTQGSGMRAMNLANTVAQGINTSGQAVGYWVPSAHASGIVWTQTKGVQNLNPLLLSGPRIAAANAINKVGQIAGASNNHALLLTPVSN
jgi:probable HAF family extracellular repeat protein